MVIIESGEKGAGVHFPRGNDNDLVHYLGVHSSVFLAEVLAITLAAERLTSTIPGETDVEGVTIYSDSQAAIKALASLRTRSKTVNH